MKAKILPLMLQLQQMPMAIYDPALESVKDLPEIAAQMQASRPPEITAGYFEEWYQEDYLEGVAGRRVEGKPYNLRGATAIIPLHGILVHRYGYCLGFITGYGYVAAAIQEALKDDEVEQIVLDVNSAGGSVMGLFELAADIRVATLQKPVHAIVDGLCCSAAYALTSACTSVITTPSSYIGSIGVVSTHFSIEGMNQQAGIEVTHIQAGDKKTDGTPYKNLTESARKDIKQNVDELYEQFVATVARNRNLDAVSVRNTQAATYSADQAKQLGLIDEIMTVKEAFTHLTSKEEVEMPKENQTATENVAQVQANGATAERERIQAILSAEAAKTMPSMANRLAFQTDMSAEEAVALLAEAAKDIPAAEQPAPTPAAEQPTPAPAATQAQPSPLDTAMAMVGSPNVGADNAATNESAANLKAVADLVNSVNL